MAEMVKERAKIFKWVRFSFTTLFNIIIWLSWIELWILNLKLLNSMYFAGSFRYKRIFVLWTTSRWEFLHGFFKWEKECKEARERKKIKSPVYEKCIEFPFIANNDITYVFFAEIKTEYGTLYIYTVRSKVEHLKFNEKLSIFSSSWHWTKNLFSLFCCRKSVFFSFIQSWKSNEFCSKMSNQQTGNKVIKSHFIPIIQCIKFLLVNNELSFSLFDET